MPEIHRKYLSRCILLCTVTCIVVFPAFNELYAGHNPPRPQVSYECDRFALKYNPKTDSWQCTSPLDKATRNEIDRIRELQKQNVARIRKLLLPGIGNQKDRNLLLWELNNEQKLLTRELDQLRFQ